MATKEQINRRMAFAGLAFFGGASITANILSVNLPALDGDWTPSIIEAWQGSPKKADVDGWAYFWAVLFPVGALAGIEFVTRFTGLHKVMRYGVLGLASLVAIVSSYLHIVHVLLWYGQGVLISIIGPIAVDGLMILCTMQLLSTIHVTDAGQDAEDTAPASMGYVFPDVPFGFVPAYHLSSVSLGPVPPSVVPDAPRVPKARVSQDKAPKDTDAPKAPEDKVTRGGWDRAEAAKLIMSTGLDNHAIGERVGTSYKTIQRLRKEIRENPAMAEQS